MRQVLSFLFACSCCFSCTERHPDTDVVIHTQWGDIEIDLYDDTPIHKANFLRLIDDDFYEDLLFHRVISDYIIQGGDPLSRNAAPHTLLGEGDTPYLLDAEINYPTHFHKRGTLAAARKSGPENPDKQSSGCQFYLVWGQKMTQRELNRITRNRREQQTQERVNTLYAQAHDRASFLETLDDLMPLALFTDSIRRVAKEQLTTENAYYTLPDSIAKQYIEHGGTPYLDNDYTIFGEITKGLDIVEKIQQVDCDENNRPVQDIFMQISLR